MSFRTIYGKSVSAEGWRMCNADECTWVKVPGANVTIQIRSGIPATILGAFVARFNQVVEPVRDADTACWTATNSVATSNHLSAVAVDIDWDSHPFHVRGTFGDRLPKVRQVLAEFRDCVWWGGDWTDPIDEMHFELNFPEGHWAGRPEASEFIVDIDQRLVDLANDLKTGYLGIYVPGAPPPPAPTLSRADRYALLIIAEGQRRGITPRGIQIALATGLVESNLTIYANAKVPDSMNIPHDAVGSDGYSVGIFQQQVRNSGNGWWWGDAATCMDPTSSAGLFYDRLAKLDYNGPNSPGSYAQAVQSSAFPGRYDERFNDAVAIYNRLSTAAPPPPPLPGDDMALVPQDEWNVFKSQMNRVFHEVADLRESRSPVREPDEGPKDTWSGFGLNTDGSEHLEICKLLAGYRHPPTIALLKRVAAMPVDKPGREGDCLIAQAILADVTATPVTTTVVNNVAPAAATVAPADTRALDAAYAENARLREENHRLLAEAAQLRADAAVSTALVPIAAETRTSETRTSGDRVGQLVDSVEDWTDLALSMDVKQRAALAASIKVLEMEKNGSQL